MDGADSGGRGSPARLVLTLVGFGATAMLLRSWLGGPVVVGSGAMAPALQRGDIVWVDRSGGDAAVPGAVVAFRQPGDGALTVKRVIAGPGEVVEVAQGGVLVDGTAQGRAGEERWCGEPVEVRAGEDSPPEPVPVGAVYVLGDDRRASSDSRQWGPVPLDNVVGRVRFVMWGDGAPRVSVGCNGGAAPTH
jgi:signal peptidase I